MRFAVGSLLNERPFGWLIFFFISNWIKWGPDSQTNHSYPTAKFNLNSSDSNWDWAIVIVDNDADTTGDMKFNIYFGRRRRLKARPTNQILLHAIDFGDSQPTGNLTSTSESLINKSNKLEMNVSGKWMEFSRQRRNGEWCLIFNLKNSYLLVGFRFCWCWNLPDFFEHFGMFLFRENSFCHGKPFKQRKQRW